MGWRAPTRQRSVRAPRRRGQVKSTARAHRTRLCRGRAPRSGSRRVPPRPAAVGRVMGGATTSADVTAAAAAVAAA
eukprot:3712612-Prymnesium_polylepis.1